MTISDEARRAAEEAVSSANIVTVDGYYEIDIAAVELVFKAFEAQIVERCAAEQYRGGSSMTAEQTALLERLERQRVTGASDGSFRMSPGPVNPDGPEAAALIRSMQETIERLEGERDALRAKLANSMQFAGGQSPLVCGSGTASQPSRNGGRLRRLRGMGPCF